MSSFARRLGFENLELRRLLAAVEIPDDLSGQVGAEVATPVNIDDAAGVRGAEIRIAFDPDIFTLDENDIAAGSSWANAADTQLVANVDAAAGTVVIFISASAALPTGAGSLAVLGFRIRQTVAPDTNSAIDLVQVRLNEGAISVNPAPIAGPDPTDGLIVATAGTPGQADRIAGTVFVDANADGAPSASEGIPGVVITLVNVATNATRETTTGDNGQFEFLDVAAGNYRIVQTQPTAYLDGGPNHPNELTVTLAVGQNLANQNFREIGLRAAYVYNRLAMTSTLLVGSPAWISTLRMINVDAAAAAAVVTTNTETASMQAFSLGVQSDVQRNVQSSPQVAAMVQAAEPVLASTGSLDPVVSSQIFLPGQPQPQSRSLKDEDGQRLLVDDAMTQTGLW